MQQIACVSSDLQARGVSAAVDHTKLWARARARLSRELGDVAFESWMGLLRLDEVTDGVACLSVPTTFLRSWLEAHYRDAVLSALRGEDPDIRRIELRIRRQFAARMPVAAKASGAPLPRPPAPTLMPPLAQTSSADGIGSPLNPRLSFASFLVGSSNQLAHGAAERIAIADQNASPLYIHAGVGLGKTHLLQAISHAARKKKLRAVYLTAEHLMFGFLSALRARTVLAFKEKVRAVDVLAIDDFQFLQGKSLPELSLTLNSVIDAGGQIAIAADRAPHDIERLDERLRSRLAGGLCVEIEAPEDALRAKILEARIAQARQQYPAVAISPEVVAYVARMILTNGRDLDAAVRSLVAHATLTESPLTVDTAGTAIQHLVRPRQPKRVRIEDIQTLVARHYNVTRIDILSSRRTNSVVLPRQVAMYLSRKLTLRSLPEIGRRFGGRDHTTCLHACKKIDGLITGDRAFGEEIEAISLMLTAA